MSTRDVLYRYATPFTTGLFAISLISGVALFFHVGSTWARGMHEILSMVLILPFALHIWRNWPTFLAYFRRWAMWIGLAVSLVLAVPFMLDDGGAGGASSGDPRALVFGAMANADVSALAALAKTDATTVISRLSAAGYQNVAPTDTASDLAKRAGRDSFDVVAAALKP